MTRRNIIRLAGVLVLVGIGLVLVLVFFQDDPEEGAGPLPSGEIPVSEEAQELTTLTRKGQDLTYHAVYEVAGAQPTGGSLEIQLWRKEGLVRQDQEIRAEGRVLRTSGFRLDNRTISCVREDDDPWRCQGVPETTGSATPPPDPLIAAVVGELANKQVTAKDDEVGGRDARCFTIKDTTQTSELCITDDGIPVRIATAQATMELTELEDDVDDDIFDPPADVAAPGGAP
ncbi:MAG: hypothetical protein WD646_00855 [Actinomycetota bacterium]